MPAVHDTKQLQRGRDAYRRREWSDAHDQLRRADELDGLGADDLELLATAAYMRGHSDEHLEVLRRAHRAHEAAGDHLRAARCAFWVGQQLLLQGELGAAGGWHGRAQRLVDAAGTDSVERVYLRVPEIFRLAAQGDAAAAAALCGELATAARRHGEADLVALALQQQGRLLIAAGDVTAGLGLLDEAMLAVSAGELSPIPSGIVYCGVISGCQAAFEVRRAQEWTSALTRWCDEQPGLLSFTGTCLVHRAEILQLRGAWPDALEEARRAGARCRASRETRAAALARYVEAELHRLQGRHAEAEAAYREAAHGGWDPQPGLALLRLAQGETDVAATALRRVLAETPDLARQAALLPATVEVLLADGDTEGAREACERLAQLAAGHPSALLAASVAHSQGAVALAGGDPRAALPLLRRGRQAWQDLGAPYEAARVRMLIGAGCRALGDEDAAAMEVDAAVEAFAALGAVPDVEAARRLRAGAGGADPAHGLTVRELQVLRMVAGGATNRAIAAELVLSERTVDRHVSNILAKLRVPSRAAATAYAYEHRLL